MSSFKRLFSASTVGVALSAVLGFGAPACAAAEVDEVARTISVGVGVVGAKSATGKGTAVIVFEEDHGSISGQIEQALMLTRLRDKFGLREVVLEGYSGSGLEASARKVREAVAGRSNSSIERIAATLVREGELSAAEFMSIAYPDVRIVKGESAGGATSGEREQTVDFFMNSRPLLALIAVEHQALKGPEVDRFLSSLKALFPVDSSSKAESLIKLCEAVIEKDPWTRSRNEILFPNGRTIVPIEQELTAIREIRAESNKLPQSVAALAKSAEVFERFLQGRRQASAELVKSSVERAANGGRPVVALVVGAAHTAGVSGLLADAKVPYAVLRSASLGSPRDVRLPSRSYDRKLLGLSASGALAGALEIAFPVATRHKPAPVLEQDCLSAKVEMYGMVDDLAERLGKSRALPQAGGAGGGGTKPPSFDALLAGIPEDSLRGRFMFIDRKRVKEREENGRRVFVFPIVLNPGDSSRTAKGSSGRRRGKRRRRPRRGPWCRRGRGQRSW